MGRGIPVFRSVEKAPPRTSPTTPFENPVTRQTYRAAKSPSRRHRGIGRIIRCARADAVSARTLASSEHAWAYSSGNVGRGRGSSRAWGDVVRDAGPL